MAQPISNLSLNSKVKFGKYQGKQIIWKIADKNHSGYPSNSVTLVSDDIICLKAFDAKEPTNNVDTRKAYGNNRYSYSNIRQWLNKSGYPWYTSQHSADTPPNGAGVDANPYDVESGFLTEFLNDELNAILDTTLLSVIPDIDGGGTESLTDKIFLLSRTEVGLGNESSVSEGSQLPIFTNNNSRIALYNGSSAYWWLRTPNQSRADEVRFIADDGTQVSGSAYQGNFGIRPALNLKASVMVSDTPDGDGAYTMLWIPGKPTGLSPASEVKMNNEVIRFSWVHNNIVGDTQSKFDLQWSSNGGQTWNTITQTTSNQYYDMPANTFPAGNIVWRVRTYSAQGLVGEYSDQVSFTAAGKPDTPVLTLPNPIENTSRPTLAWTSTGQIMYQAQILKDSNIIWDSGEVASEGKQIQIGADLVEDLDYIARVRIKNQYDLWSDWATKAFSVQFDKPNKPYFDILKDINRASVRLTISNPTPDGAGGFQYNEIYRRQIGGTWIRIATGIERNGIFEDCALASGKPYEYKIRTIGTHGYMDSDVKYANIRVRNSQLASVSDKDMYVPLIYEPTRNISLSMDRTLMKFAGREKPVTEYGEHKEFGMALSFVIKDIEDVDTLMALVESGETLLYRDNRGRKIYCTIGSVDIQEERKYWTVSFSIAEVSHQEEV